MIAFVTMYNFGFTDQKALEPLERLGLPHNSLWSRDLPRQLVWIPKDIMFGMYQPRERMHAPWYLTGWAICLVFNLDFQHCRHVGIFDDRFDRFGMTVCEIRSDTPMNELYARSRSRDSEGKG